MATATGRDQPRAAAARSKIVGKVEVELGHSKDVFVQTVVATDPRMVADEVYAAQFTIGGAPCDSAPLEYDGRRRPRTQILRTRVPHTAIVEALGREPTPGTFVQLPLARAPGVGALPPHAYALSQPPTISILIAGVGGLPAAYICRPELVRVFQGGTHAKYDGTATFTAPPGAPELGMVVRVFVTVRADDICEIELVMVNHLQEYTLGSPSGDFAYTRVQVSIQPPAGAGPWMARQFSPRAIESWTTGPVLMLTLINDGKPHLWIRSIPFLVRIAAGPAIDRAQVEFDEAAAFFGYGFCVSGPHSFYENRAYGPEGGPLAPWGPSYDMYGPKGIDAARAQLGKDIAGIVSQRTTGKAGNSFPFDRMGMFHHMGQAQEGEPGGWRVRPHGTFALDRRLLVVRRLELEHSCMRLRRAHLGRDGTPTTALKWARAFGGRVPFAWENAGDRQFPWMRYRRVNGEMVRDGNKTVGSIVMVNPAEVELQRKIDPQDNQHEERDQEPAETLCRHSDNDGAAVILSIIGTNAELGRHSYPHATDGIQSHAGLDLLVFANADAGNGTPAAGRALAWDLRAMAGLASFQPAPARERWVPTFLMLFEFASKARAPMGWLQRDYPYDPKTGKGGHNSLVAIKDEGAPPGYRYAQTFELAYLELAYEAAIEVVSGLLDPEIIQTQREDGLRSMESLLLPEIAGETGLLATFIAVGPNEGPAFQVPEKHVSNKSEATWIFGIAAAAARTEARLNRTRAPLADDPHLARLLVIGQPPAHPHASFAAYLAAAQALEKEPWKGSWAYAGTAWGEAAQIAAQQQKG